MSIKPDSLTLLEAARASLVDGVAPSLKGAERYEALLIANAISIIARELKGDETGETESGVASLLEGLALPDTLAVDSEDRALANAIRAGGFDHPAQADRLRAYLRRSTLRTLGKTNPGVAAKYAHD